MCSIVYLNFLFVRMTGMACVSASEAFSVLVYLSQCTCVPVCLRCLMCTCVSIFPMCTYIFPFVRIFPICKWIFSGHAPSRACPKAADLDYRGQQISSVYFLCVRIFSYLYAHFLCVSVFVLFVRVFVRWA